MPKPWAPATICTAAAALFGACATPSDMPSGWAAGRFVTLRCTDNKSFQVRLSEDGRTARVRAHPGSAELDSRGDGRYAGDGYSLNLRGEGGAALDHEGKSEGKACRPAA